MKIQKIENQSITYGAKKHFLTNEMRSSVESLLIRMNAETGKITEHDCFQPARTTKLRYGNVVFEDKRGLTKKLTHNVQMQGSSTLTIGKIILDIDNKTGEITDYKKPFYKPWFLVLKKVKNILSEMRANFYNEEIITKEREII